MEVTGKIIKVLELRSGVAKTTGNSWESQDYVLEIPNGQYPRRMVFNVFGKERIDQFNIKEGQTLTVSFDIDAREYQGRWFNSIRAWRVQEGQEQLDSSLVDLHSIDNVQSSLVSSSEEEPDDLPF